MSAIILIPSRNFSERAMLRIARRELSSLNSEQLDVLIRTSMNKSILLYEKVFQSSYFGVEERRQIILKNGFVRYIERTKTFH